MGAPRIPCARVATLPQPSLGVVAAACHPVVMLSVARSQLTRVPVNGTAATQFGAILHPGEPPCNPCTCWVLPSCQAVLDVLPAAYQPFTLLFGAWHRPARLPVCGTAATRCRRLPPAIGSQALKGPRVLAWPYNSGPQPKAGLQLHAGMPAACEACNHQSTTPSGLLHRS